MLAESRLLPPLHFVDFLFHCPSNTLYGTKSVGIGHTDSVIIITYNLYAKKIQEKNYYLRKTSENLLFYRALHALSVQEYRHDPIKILSILFLAKMKNIFLIRY